MKKTTAVYSAERIWKQLHYIYAIAVLLYGVIIAGCLVFFRESRVLVLLLCLLSLVVLGIIIVCRGEASLRMQNARYKILHETSQMTVFEYDVATDTFFYSAVASGEGDSRDVCHGYLQKRNFRNSVREDYWEEYEKFFLDAMRANQSKSREFPLKLLREEYIWYRITFMPVRNACGLLEHLVGSAMDINDLVLAREDALEKAATDGMTGLLNHTAAEKSIMGLLSKNREMCCAMLIVDIDDLKGINDSLGHMQGDRAICSVAELLRASFRSSDIVGRIGGDEFIVFLLNPPDEKKFAEILMRLMQSMPEIRVGNSNAHSVHISIGVAIGRAGEESFPSLFQKADAALYYVKWHGKAAFAIFRQDMQDFAHVEQLPAQHKGG